MSVGASLAGILARFDLVGSALRILPASRVAALGARLIDRKDFETADLVLARGLSRHGADRRLLELHAVSAHNSGRYLAAVERWSRLRAKHPDVPMAWSGLAANLRESGDVDRAADVIAGGLAQFPLDAIAISEAIRIADARADHEQSADLWPRFLQLVPRTAEDWARCIAALLRVDRIDAAADEITLARQRFPDEGTFVAQAIVVTAARQQWVSLCDLLDDHRRRFPSTPASKAVRDRAIAEMMEFAASKVTHEPLVSEVLWQRLTALDPANPVWSQFYVDNLMRIGALDAADAECSRARRLNPTHAGLWRESGMLAAKRELWDDAVEILKAYLGDHPQDEYARVTLGHALMEQTYATDAKATSVADLVHQQDVGRVEDDDIRQLLMRFESIGHDCEFGLVQRRYGAEPIGLFRWNSTNPRSLIDALDLDLQGLGDPEHTIMSLWGDFEYYVADRRWGFGLHTFLSRHEIAAEILYPKMCRRIGFLRERFLTDLRGAEKTFVFTSSDIDLATLRALHAALRRHGPARLVCIKPLSVATVRPLPEAGRVFEIGEALHLAYITNFGNFYPVWKIRFDDWIAICRGIVAGVFPLFPGETI